jgi:hypothetical protein
VKRNDFPLKNSFADWAELSLLSPVAALIARQAASQRIRSMMLPRFLIISFPAI